MGQKDLTQKDLELYPEVFAELVNVLLHEGRQLLEAESLHPAPTETVYPAGEKKLRNQLQDAGMDEMKDGRIYVRYMIENQTRVDRKMVFRKASYQGACYRKQYDTGVIFPLVGMVLYWGKKRWKNPHDLKEFFQQNHLSCAASHMDDVRLNLYEMTKLSKETREKFKTDIRVIIDYLAEGKEYTPSRQKLKHPEAVLRMLSALTGDVRFKDIIEEVKDKEEIRMCELIDRYEQRGLKRGRREGRKQGRMLGKAEEIVFLGEELKWSADDIVSRLKSRLNIQDAEARKYYESYRSKNQPV